MGKDKAAFDKCDFAGAKNLGAKSPVKFSTTKAGTYFFGCKVTGHCKFGNQRLFVKVTGSKGGKPTCKCPKIHKPVCGKDGKTYPNSCIAKCKKVAIKEHKACAQNMEAARVFSTFLKGNSKWMSDFQKSWKCGSKMPIATTKKTVGTTKAAYAFNFSNGCAVTIVYDTKKNSAKRESSKCSTGKCVDNASMLKKFVEEFNLPKASTCATLYKLIDEEY